MQAVLPAGRAIVIAGSAGNSIYVARYLTGGGTR